MVRPRIVVVEDDPDLSALVAHALERAHACDVSQYAAGDAALRGISDAVPDLVILDLNLPGMGGLEVCRALRSRQATQHVPVLMLTANAGEADRVAGFDVGADDYVTKPFSLRELTARVKALLRRSAQVEDRPVLVYTGTHLTADFDAVAVSVDEAPIQLTRREFELLRYLVQNRSRVVSRERLLERVWGYERQVDTRSIDVHVGRLRQKLGPAGRQIETVVGLGYRFVD